jgi:hypothetical protein
MSASDDARLQHYFSEVDREIAAERRPPARRSPPSPRRPPAAEELIAAIASGGVHSIRVSVIETDARGRLAVDLAFGAAMRPRRTDFSFPARASPSSPRFSTPRRH